MVYKFIPKIFYKDNTIYGIHALTKQNGVQIYTCGNRGVQIYT